MSLRRQVTMLKSRRGGEQIWYTNIASPTFDPAENAGISYESAAATIHVILPSGDIKQGLDGLTLLYGQVVSWKRPQTSKLA